jgi:SAM-dependent methyltransferase
LSEHCPFCAGAAGDRVDAREMMFGLRDRFVYRRCAQCESLWLAEPPASLDPYYPHDYYSLTADPKGALPIPAAELWTRTLLRLPLAATQRLAGKRGFPRYIEWCAGLGLTPRSRVADIGSGAGHLVYQLGRHGFRDVWGFDPFLDADRDLGHVHLRRREIGPEDGSFDLVMFHHSLEHVADPVDALRTVAARVSAGGTIIVRVPVAGSFADRCFGADWVAIDAPRHLAIPSQAGMTAAAARAGLTISRTFFDSTALQFWASEQYANDVPLHDERSGGDPARNEELERNARALNRTGEGDSAGYVLTVSQ